MSNNSNVDIGVFRKRYTNILIYKEFIYEKDTYDTVDSIKFVINYNGICR